MSNDPCSTGYQVTTLTSPLQSNFPISKITIELDLQDLALKFYFSLHLFSLSGTDTGNKK